MHEDCLDAERIGNAAGMLATGTTEARQRELRDIVAALHRYLLDRTSHVCDGDAPESRSQVESAQFGLARSGDLLAEDAECRHYRGRIVQDLTWKDPQHTEAPFVAEADAEGRVRYTESAEWEDLPDLDTGEPRRKLRWLLHPRFALVVREFFPELEVRGREVRAGREVIVLAPSELPFEHYALYFDRETALLSHVGYHNDVESWQRVDGVLFPHRWVFGRKGGHTTYLFEEIADGAAPGPM